MSDTPNAANPATAPMRTVTCPRCRRHLDASVLALVDGVLVCDPKGHMGKSCARLAPQVAAVRTSLRAKRRSAGEEKPQP